MKAEIALIVAKVNELLTERDSLLKELEEFGWVDDRPQKTDSTTQDILIQQLTAFHIPATAKVPSSFVQRYHQWYSSGLALVEVNMKPRHKELEALHKEVSGLLAKGMSFDDQVAISTRIIQMGAIISGIPSYIEGRLLDLEMAVSQAYIGQELEEAALLVKRGHIRAAGAIAGVLLERHLKNLCDRHQPPIKYPKSAGISKLNDLLKAEGVYDTNQWRRVQWMGDIRNSCDHASTTNPRKSDVEDLIQEVRKFVALFAV